MELSNWPYTSCLGPKRCNSLRSIIMVVVLVEHVPWLGTCSGKWRLMYHYVSESNEWNSEFQGYYNGELLPDPSVFTDEELGIPADDDDEWD